MLFFQSLVLILFFQFAGLGLVARAGTRPSPWVSLVIGYCHFHLVFYLLFLLTENRMVAFSSAMASILLFSVWSFKHILQFFKELPGTLRNGLPEITGCLFVLAVCTFYFYAGSGPFHFLSANPDGFDGIAGAALYSGNAEFLRGMQYDLLTSRNFDHNLDVVIARVIGSTISIQYSSIAGVSLLLGELSLFKACIAQLCVCMVMTFLGLVHFFQRITNSNQIVSHCYALFCLLNSLFFIAFVNLHIGQLIFGGLLPFLFVQVINRQYEIRTTRSEIVLSVICLLLLLMTYPQPLIFFGAMFILVFLFDSKFAKKILESIPKRALTVLGVLASMLIFTGLYLLANKYSLVEGNMRAWRLSLTPEMISVFWGMRLGELSIVKTVLETPYEKIIFLVMGALLLCGALYGLVGIIKKSALRLIFLSWMSATLFLVLVIKDSYYFYKFLHLTQFIIVSGLFLTLWKLWTYSWGKVLCVTVLVVLMIGNFRTHERLYNSVASSAYNNNTQLADDIAQLDVYRQDELFLDIPDPVWSTVIRYMRLDRGSGFLDRVENSKYIARMNGAPDINFDTELTIHRDLKKLKILDSRAEYLITEFSLYSAVEFQKNSPNWQQNPFRWQQQSIEFEFGSTKMSRGISVIRGRSKTDRLLRICYEVGPSLAHQQFSTLQIKKDDGIEAHKVSGIGCVYSEVKSGHFRYELLSADHGVPLDYDSRILNFKIGLIGLADKEYDDVHIKFLNPYTQASPDFLIGNGWFPLEKRGMRWGTGQSEIILPQAQGINIFLEKGPSVDGELRVTVNGGINILVPDERIISIKHDSGDKRILSVKMTSGKLAIHGHDKRLLVYKILVPETL